MPFLNLKVLQQELKLAMQWLSTRPIDRIVSGTVQPGHYLVMVTGSVATVEEAVKAGKDIGKDALLDNLFLPNVHPEVVNAIAGEQRPAEEDALGILETHTVASAIHAADAGLKGADVSLVQLRLADGLGGKGLTMFHGLVADVEAAMEIGTAVSHPQLVRNIIIPQLHADMWDNVNQNGRFGHHFSWSFS